MFLLGLMFATVALAGDAGGMDFDDDDDDVVEADFDESNDGWHDAPRIIVSPEDLEFQDSGSMIEFLRRHDSGFIERNKDLFKGIENTPNPLATPPGNFPGAGGK